MNRVDLSRRIIVENWKWLSGSLSYIPTLNAPVHYLLKQLQLEWVPNVANWQWVVSLMGVAVLFLLREPRLVAWLTRLALGRVAMKADMSLFIGARPYTAEDTLPDRDADEKECWRKIRAGAFFILEGESGCGKSSLLNARLLPRARKHFQVVESRVEGEPFDRIACAFLKRTYSRGREESMGEEDLTKAIDSRSQPQAGQGKEGEVKPILLCLDQFEELFQSVRDKTRKRLAAFLKSAIEQGKIRLIVAIRSDYRDLLIGFCRQADPDLATFKLRNDHKLAAFGRQLAEEVVDEILAPACQGNALLEVQLRFFGSQLVDELLRPPSDPRLYSGDEKKVLPVELQIAGYLLQSRGIAHLDRKRLRDAGGYAGLMREYIQNAKSEIMAEAGVEGSKALMILQQLAPSERVKGPAKSAEEIAEAVRLPLRKTEHALEVLCRLYIVNRQVEGDDLSNVRYALMHDHVARIIAEAPDPQSQKQRDARERLQFWMQRAALSATEGRTERSFVGRLQSVFAQPISLIEAFRLWPYAGNSESRRFLRRSFTAFACRFAAFGLPLLGLAGYYGYEEIQRQKDIGALESQLRRDDISGEIALKALVDLARVHGYAVERLSELLRERGSAAAILEAAEEGQDQTEADLLLAVQCAKALLPKKLNQDAASSAPDIATVLWLLDAYLTRSKMPNVAAEAAELRKSLVRALQEGRTPEISDEDWASILPGSFRMGSESGDNDETPHDVKVSAFRILKHEVTNQEFAALFGDRWDEAAKSKPDLPAASMTWHQAYVFSAWLGGRLPTEAEWEYAARSGGKNREYPWGKEIADCSRAVISGCGGPLAVCSKPDGNTEQGVCDMAGNVWEWTADWWGLDPSSDNRVIRGGSFDDDADGARAANRDMRYSGSSRNRDLGFRVVLSPPPER